MGSSPPKMALYFMYICYMVTDYTKQFKIKDWSLRSKELLYKKAYQNGLSLNEQIKKVIREYLHREFPDEIIE